MNKKSVKVLILLLILGFYGSFLVYKITLPGAQDLPRQMQNGKDVLQGHYEVLTKNVYSYIEPGQPFANHHWFYGVIAYILHQAVGYTGMVLFKIFFLLLMLAGLLYATLKKANFWLVAILSLPTIIILINRTALRPEMFSYFFVALFLYLLTDLQENPEHKRAYWLVPAQLIWVNTHLFFWSWDNDDRRIPYSKFNYKSQKLGWHETYQKVLMDFFGVSGNGIYKSVRSSRGFLFFSCQHFQNFPHSQRRN